VDTDWDPYHDEIAKFNIRVVKDEVEEPEVFYNGEIAGVLQRVGEKARWGNIWFSGNVGGVVANRIGHPTTTFLTDLANTPADAWTPLAETFYVCMRHFMQQSCESGLGYGTDAQNVKPQNDTWDPYMQDGQVISCSDAFVILLTDGAPTGDEGIPAGLRDYDGDSRDPGIWGLQGTDYLDDVALYAHTVDLRPDHIVNYDGTVQAALNDKALDGDQNITLYTIFASTPTMTPGGCSRTRHGTAVLSIKTATTGRTETMTIPRSSALNGTPTATATRTPISRPRTGTSWKSV
jgi:hypothetical protein